MNILHILHTNDVHSRFHNMPQIATCLKQHRSQWEKQGEHVLTVDIGDHVDRMNMKTEASWGQTNIDVLNQCGYQYVTIGNNEGLTLPKEKLDALYQRAEFTVILSNLREPADERLPGWAVPHAIHQWNQIRVAILGVTAPFSPSYEILGWRAIDPFPLLKRQVEALREQVDAVLVLSHLGYQRDRQMAEEIAGIDVILGAHTHHLLPQGERVGSSLIAQVGRFGDNVGHVELVFDQASKKLLSSRAEAFATHTYDADPRLHSFLQAAKADADRELSQPLARLTCDLQINWEEETPFASFLAASIRRWTDAEIGLANAGLLLAPLKSGDVTHKDLLQSVPHPINPCAVTLTGEQLVRLLQRAMRPEFVQKELPGFGFRGKKMGWMGIDGITVEYENGRLPVIRSVQVEGKPLDLKREYRVATVNMFAFNRLLPELLEGRELRFFLPEMLRDILAETLHDDDLVRSSFIPRWRSLPLR